MKQRFFSLLFSIVAGVLCVTAPVYAQDYGLNATADAADLDQYGSSVPALVGKVIGTGLSLVSVVFFVLMIYGGIRWMISRGNEDQAKKALDTIVAAIIGLIIVMASYAITNFVFNSVKVDAGGGTTSGASTASCKVDPIAKEFCEEVPVADCGAESICTVSGSSCVLSATASYCASFLTQQTCPTETDGCTWE